MSQIVSKKTIRVKFNYPCNNPAYDFSKAMKLAKEEKSWIAYNNQKNIDMATVDAIFYAGSTHDISEELYKTLSERMVETFNPLFGSFQGLSLELIKRPKIPFVLKVDGRGNVLDPNDEKLDLHPKVAKEIPQHVGSLRRFN